MTGALMGWAFPPIDVLVVVEVTVSLGGVVPEGVLVSVGLISSITGGTSSTTTGAIVVVLEQKVRHRHRLKSIMNLFIIG
jgi:hypothetical protein